MSAEKSSFTVTALVSKIERYAIHDGPGIRTVVFLKGCPLRCIWCSSPECQNPYLELAFDEKKCIGCRTCASLCQDGAISFDPLSVRSRTDFGKCTNCGKCVQECPSGARRLFGTRMELQEIMDIVQRDSPFYWRSGGGVTISGGEPLSQPEFLLEFLRECKTRNLHTAMETCGVGPWKTLGKALEFVDWLYFDIKHMESDKHKEITGASNEAILQNATRASRLVHSQLRHMVIRIPVISKLNGSRQNIESTSKFVSRLDGVDGIELLPYHRLGEPTYRHLGRPYELGNALPPSDQEMAELREIVETTGVRCLVGWRGIT